MRDDNKVVVGMSGGVDSSVAAALLVEKGFEVFGLTITPFKIDSQCRTTENERSCCSYQSVLDANDVCKKIGIEHFLTDLTEIFRERVVDNFIGEYLNGRTPNPCVICNHTVKWYAMLKKAEEIGAEFVATGHYSKINRDEKGNYHLIRGSDGIKDQSYFLWKLSQEQLARTLFPLGEFIKSDTRKIASELDLPVKSKVESQEICFIPKDDYRSFLLEQVPDLQEKIGTGSIKYNDSILGTHNGFPFYTVGQRKGLGISHSEPLYIKSINATENIINVGTISDIKTKTLRATDYNIHCPEKLNENQYLTAKIRYRDKDEPAICQIVDNKLEVSFINPKNAITPGQSVVVYSGDIIVAGGIIDETE